MLRFERGILTLLLLPSSAISNPTSTCLEYQSLHCLRYRLRYTISGQFRAQRL